MHFSNRKLIPSCLKFLIVCERYRDVKTPAYLARQNQWISAINFRHLKRGESVKSSCHSKSGLDRYRKSYFLWGVFQHLKWLLETLETYNLGNIGSQGDAALCRCQFHGCNKELHFDSCVISRLDFKLLNIRVVVSSLPRSK